MKRYIFDIETDGFLEHVTKLHCLVIKCIDTGRVWSCHDHEGYTSEDPKVTEASLKHGLNMLRSADLLIGHNIICYDIPVLRKLYPHIPITARPYDTLIEARLNWPRDALRTRDFKLFKQQKMPGNMMGRHSLEAFGYRIGLMKGEYTSWCKEQGIEDAWSQWRPEMQVYCEQDVVVTSALYDRCVQENYAPAASLIEHKVAEHVFVMQQNGFPFKEADAARLYSTVCAERDALGEKLRSLFPPWYSPATVDRGDAGSRTARIETPKTNRRMGADTVVRTVNGKRKKVKVGGIQYTAGAAYCRIELKEFNPNSREHIADRLQNVRGWQPKDFTEAGTVIVDETTLSSLPYPEARPLTRFMLLQKRAGQLSEGNEGWLKIVRNGSIYGQVNALGAVTRRATHYKPNIAQVPKVGSYFGAECRALFWAGEGFEQIGVDLAGIELRMLAHYMSKWDGGAYAEAVCHGDEALGTDVHSLNAKALGLEPQKLYVVGAKQQKGRDIAKTFIYAFLYGAGAAKLARILGRPEKEGNALKARFLKGLPALKCLMDAVALTVENTGQLMGLDGGRIRVRSAHSALNSLLQSAGAIVAKWWIVETFDAFKSKGWIDGNDFLLRAWIHDELQFSVRPEIADAFGKTCVTAIETCGAQLNLRVPITGVYKRGHSWFDCH